MKRILLSAAVLMVAGFGFSQGQNNWKTTSSTSNQITTASAVLPKTNKPQAFKVYDLDLAALKGQLKTAKDREAQKGPSTLLISFPNADGSFENFRIVEADVMHPDLAAKYPGIKSYAGTGIEDPTASIRFSVSQLGFHGMVLSGQKGTYYIDPYTADKKSYMVYARKDLAGGAQPFECLTPDDNELPSMKGDNSIAQMNTNDKKLRRYRLAMSCNAEYGNIFAGASGTDAQKKANILAQMNITMTRVNGIYERDLAITMQLVANNDLIIYYGSTTTDPWSNEWNTKTQQVIDAAIGNANYDIGHNFNTTGGGNAGCIGCVCTTGSKGSGYTGRADPTGDAFDVDYVAHEMGHQFGGYHTMNTCSRSGSGTTEVEPASGSSIMGYAGICPTNIQANSDAYFAYVNIRDISANVKTGVSSACAVVVNLTNNAPTANAGADFTIPKSTAFVLKGAGSDIDGDALTYTWEQNDPAQAAGTGSPVSTWTAGPMFRSRTGTSSPDRYMPQMSDVVANNLTPTWEVIPSVARTLNFSLVVRDNKAGGGQTASDLMKVTVASTGPFSVSAPNTAVSWSAGSSQTVTWNVASSNVAPVSCANVNILLSTDGGYTYPVVLLANTPNDGTQAITVPSNVSSTCRVKVEAVGNIFYDISNVNFSITGAVSCTATTPTGLAASNVGSTTATLGWTAVSGTTYDVNYRIVGAGTWTNATSGTNSLNLTGLTALTQYEAQVRSVCPSSSSAYSANINFTTTAVQITYCAANGNSTADEYISRVQLGTINNTSTAGAGGYSNFTAISTSLTKGTAYTVSVTPTWPGTSYNEGYAVFIDYNQDGDFADAGETVFTKAPSKTTPATGSITISATAATGATRMRVAMSYNAIPVACGSFSYGEVEDYTVNLAAATADTQAPSTPTNLAASGITQTSANLTWTASTDNVGVTGYNVYVNGTLTGSPTATNYALSGLTAATTYAVTVRARDAAGNLSTAASVNVTTSAASTCINTTLTLKFDNYPEETSWNIKNAGGTIVASGGTYASQADQSTLVLNNCLPAGCYTFTITDAYGDGICCSYGNGSYSLTNTSTGAVLASGSTFTTSATTNFCVATSKTGRDASSELALDAVEITLYPNPVRDYLNINTGGKDITSVRVYTASGASINNLKIDANGVDVSTLKTGVYLISVESDGQVIRKKFVKE